MPATKRARRMKYNKKMLYLKRYFIKKYNFKYDRSELVNR